MPYLRHIYLLLAVSLIIPVIIAPVIGMQANAMTVPSIEIVAGEPESTRSDQDNNELEQDDHNKAAEKDVETKDDKDYPDSQTSSPATSGKDQPDQ